MKRKLTLLCVALSMVTVNVSAEASHKKHTHQKATVATSSKSSTKKHPAIRTASVRSKYRLSSDVLEQHKVKLAQQSPSGIRVARPNDTSADDEMAVNDERYSNYRMNSDAAMATGGAIASESMTFDHNGMPQLSSSKALIVHQDTGQVIYAKNTDVPTPIASVTKLMTAMVMLDAALPLDETLTVSEDDVDTLKGTSSRLRVGTELTRGELLHLALMSSENRAAHALGRNYPGGTVAFVNAMNTKARMLGMTRTHFVDPTGLNSDNVSTAEDLAKMVRAAYQYKPIRQVTTTASQQFAVNGYRSPVNFMNTNALVRSTNNDWVIGLSKTGYISEAGRCLVMQAEVAGQPLIFVLLDSAGKMSRIGDANRIKRWVEGSYNLKHSS